MISYRKADLIDTYRNRDLPDAVWFFNDDRKAVKKYDDIKHAIVVTSPEHKTIPLKPNDRVYTRPNNIRIIVDADEVEVAKGMDFYINGKKVGKFDMDNVIGDLVYTTDKPSVFGDKGVIHILDFFVDLQNDSIRATSSPIMIRKADIKDRIVPKRHLKLEKVKLSDLVTGIDEYRAVVYIPQHANGDPTHVDAHAGRITSWNHKYVFVNFGGGDTSQACDPSDLIWMFNYEPGAKSAGKSDYVECLGTMHHNQGIIGGPWSVNPDGYAERIKFILSNPEDLPAHLRFLGKKIPIGFNPQDQFCRYLP